MTGKDFENIVLQRLRDERKRGHVSAGRYGVQATTRKEVTRHVCPSCRHDWSEERFMWQPLQSLPDLEGVLPPSGRQFTFECKVCGSASFGFHDTTFSDRQLRHLLERDEFGAVSFLLLHFTERVLKTKSDPAATWAFPIGNEHVFWQAVDRGEIKSINRDDCEQYAVSVEWNKLPGGRTPRPDVLAAVHALARLKDHHWMEPARA